MQEIDTKSYSILHHIEDSYWKALERKTLSPLVHLMSNYVAYREYCIDRDLSDNADICALAFVSARNEYDNLWSTERKWYD